MDIKELCDCLDNLDNFTPETCRFDKEYGQEKDCLWDELKGHVIMKLKAGRVPRNRISDV